MINAVLLVLTKLPYRMPCFHYGFKKKFTAIFKPRTIEMNSENRRIRVNCELSMDLSF